MKISDVRIRLIQKDDSKLKGVASMTIEDCFVVHDIKIIEGQEGYFIAMPSRKDKNASFSPRLSTIEPRKRPYKKL